MSLVEDIGAALVAAGYSNIRYYRFDSASLDQICIILGGGYNIIVSGGDVEHPNVQIQVRDAALQTAETRALAIKSLLHKKTNLSNSVGIFWDGRAPDYWIDDNNLNIFSIEFKVIRST